MPSLPALTGESERLKWTDIVGEGCPAGLILPCSPGAVVQACGAAVGKAVHQQFRDGGWIVLYCKGIQCDSEF
jgi:hypothetical protein